MKLRLAVGSLAMIGTMMIAPLSAQAGGLRDRSHCPLEWLRHHHAQAAPAPAKAAPAKKAAKPMKAAAKPMK